ncbi:MAG: GNAT family N-acetyltransferase [Ardenticatenaceae bacterium]|nr:GNAT family N-acetyltransferase [Ardenticatenaceae bacterium]
MFAFHNFNRLSDGIIDLTTAVHVVSDPDEGLAPAYGFHIHPHGRPDVAGRIYLRLVNSPYVTLYAGHVGYGISPPYQGNRYAARACLLIRPVALHHGFEELWITCNPDNWASRRTCEIIGAQLVEIIEVDPSTPIYQDGETHKCRYLWQISSNIGKP